MHGSTFRDCSTIIVIPSREPAIHHKVVSALQGLIAPMNQKRAVMFCIGDEVGVAYDRMIADILAHPELSKWRYVMTIESDNLPPQDAHIRLLESIEFTKWDAVSGLYHTKGEYNMPLALGSAAKYAQTGVLDFAPIDVREILAAGQLVETNGIPMGCALWRMDLFRQVPRPHFVTVADVIPDKGPVGYTQDLFFCKNAKGMGKRFGIDARVRVGHMDLATQVVY
jgi:hypothetical protein